MAFYAHSHGMGSKTRHGGKVERRENRKWVKSTCRRGRTTARIRHIKSGLQD